ncbi:MAG TPA: hypothetical protein VMH28_33620 [Candidatus Acidoferrales bacterium]|nr:hypothetical protein [Candidatus Acidoferrales bacterium]
MKSFTSKLMITAAALVVATGVASAQSLKAEIPFAFRAGGKLMAPGTYQVADSDSKRYLVLHNYEAKASVIMIPALLKDPPKAWAAKGDPVIAFACGTGPCELAEIWSASGYPAMTFSRGKSGSVEQASLTEIRLVRANGD